jgi:hypothetical protein
VVVAVGQLYLLKKMLGKQGQGYTPVWSYMINSIMSLYPFISRVELNGAAVLEVVNSH